MWQDKTIPIPVGYYSRTEDWIEVDITATRGKNKKRYFPRPFYIRRTDLPGFLEKHFANGHQYYMVPLSQVFTKLPEITVEAVTENTTTIQPDQPMGGFMTAEEAKVFNTGAKERQSQFSGDPRAILPVGPAVLILESMTHEDKEGRIYLISTFKDPEEKYRPIVERLAISGTEPYVTTNKKILAERFQRAFNFEYGGADTAELFVAQFKKFCGRKLNAVIKHRPNLYYPKDQPGKIILTNFAQIWYVDAEGKTMSYNAAKLIDSLKAEDQQVWDDYLAKNPEEAKRYNIAIDFAAAAAAKAATHAAAPVSPEAQAGIDELNEALGGGPAPAAATATAPIQPAAQVVTQPVASGPPAAGVPEDEKAPWE